MSVSECAQTCWKRKRTLVNVGENTTLSDRDVTKQLVQLLIVPDGKLKMTGDDTGLLVVASSVTSQLEDFGRKVLEDGSKVDRSTGTDTLSVVALAEKTVNTTDGEGETSLGRTTAQSRQMKSKLELKLEHDKSIGKTREPNPRRVKNLSPNVDDAKMQSQEKRHPRTNPHRTRHTYD